MENQGQDLSQTGILRERISYIGDVEELKERHLSELQRESAAWQEKIREIMEENRYSQKHLAQLCEVSRPAVGKWCTGSIPGGRDTFIKIGFAAHYDLEQMNQFLVRYGKCPALYAKSLEDSIYIFVLSSEMLPHTYMESKRIMKRVEDALKGIEPGEKGITDTNHLKDALVRLKSEAELECFIRENLSEYKSAYSKFYDQVMASIYANSRRLAVSNRAGESLIVNVEQIANEQDWSASLRQCVYEIQRRSWFPRRRSVISLGLHLNMTVDEINELLQLAQMETLCAKDPVESAIIFAIEDAEVRGLLLDPVDRIVPRGSLLESKELEDYVKTISGLCDHVREVMEYLELPDTEALIQDILIEW